MITCGVDFHNISQIKTVGWTVKNYRLVIHLNYTVFELRLVVKDKNLPI